MYIDTGSPVPNIPSKSRGLADENKKVFDGMEMIRNNRIEKIVMWRHGSNHLFILLHAIDRVSQIKKKILDMSIISQEPSNI